VRGPTLISVGHLIPRKGHDLIIRALADLPGLDLMIVGRGPEEEALRRLAQELGVGERVRFLGAVAQEELHAYYSAADILVLA
jgi:glycosyltransferase involved in cell wall biosynthesis